MQEIRTLDFCDISKAVIIYNESFEKPWTELDFKELLLNKTTRGFIISDKAFILYQAVLDEAEIITIAVSPKHRRQGFAKILINKLQSIYDTIFLEVNEHNNIALSLYKSCNFNITGKRLKYYNNQDTALTMTYSLIKS